MKLFHLSDLHIGKIVNGYEMWEDQRYVFDQILAYVREEQETSKFQYASKNIYDIFVRAEKNVIWNSPIMMFTVYTCIILISWFGAKMIVVKSLTTGELMSLLAYCMNILMSLMMLSMVFVMISMSMASMRRIAEVLDETSDIHNPEHPLTKKTVQRKS